MKAKINNYVSDLGAEVLKLWCYVPPTFLDDATISSRMFYAFYAFKMAIDIKLLDKYKQPIAIIMSSSKFVMHYCSTALLKDFIQLLFFIILLHFRELYCNSAINVYNLKIFLQFEL